LGYHPYRYRYGRVTIRYGEPSGRPQILWDNRSLTLLSLGTPLPLDELIPEACEALCRLFENDPTLGHLAIDSFFESFTPAWLSLLRQNRTIDAAKYWHQVLTPVREWERKSNKSVHKGTPYYFLGATYIYGRNFDLGLRYLYDAIEQDKKLFSRLGNPESHKSAPAYMLASLVDNPGNFLYNDIIAPTRGRIERFLAIYRAKGASMQLKDFDRRFLGETSLEVQKLFFVYVLFEMIKQESAWTPGEDPNDFSKMRNRDILFDLCLVIDEVLRTRYPPATYISQGVYNLCKSKGWINSKDVDPGSLNLNLNPNVSGEKAPPPDVVVPTLLDCTLTYRGAPIRPEMSWLLLTWHIRNYAAHDLAPQNVLVKRFDEIIQSQMNALFISVE